MILFLATENIPLDQMQALPGGFFRWDQYITQFSYASREEAWEELNPLWQEDREIKINVLEERHGHENDWRVGACRAPTAFHWRVSSMHLSCSALFVPHCCCHQGILLRIVHDHDRCRQPLTANRPPATTKKLELDSHFLIYDS